MRELATVAVRHHCQRFQWFVLQSNDGARQFYVSLGAKASEDWAFMQLDVTTDAKDASDSHPLIRRRSQLT
jgi:hypothetical protein